MGKLTLTAYYKIFLGIFWVALQLYFWHKSGVKIVHDSHRFIYFAQHLPESGPFVYHHSDRYISYIWVLSFFRHLAGGFPALVFSQVMFSGLAILALYKATRKLTNAETPALVAVTLFLLWVELSAWNFYIMTESFYISFALITFYLLLGAKNLGHYLVCGLLILFMLLLRPNGFMFALAAATYFLVSFWQQYPHLRKQLIFTGTIICLLIILFLDTYLLPSFTIVEVYQRGDIIFGYWPLLIKPTTTEVPATASPLLNIILFFLQNILYFIKAGSLKLFFFFAHVKPFYSALHNLYIAFTLLPVYYFAMKARLKHRPAFCFIISFIGLQALMVFFTTEDWDGRFLLPVLPFIFILSAIGFNRVFKLS